MTDERNDEAISPACPPESTTERERNPLKRFLKILGPGLITGASDDDPSGIGTYALVAVAMVVGSLLKPKAKQS